MGAFTNSSHSNDNVVDVVNGSKRPKAFLIPTGARRCVMSNWTKNYVSNETTTKANLFWHYAWRKWWIARTIFRKLFWKEPFQGYPPPGALGSTTSDRVRTPIGPRGIVICISSPSRMISTVTGVPLSPALRRLVSCADEKTLSPA